jgi:hypothetical protein
MIVGAIEKHRTSQHWDRAEEVKKETMAMTRAQEQQRQVAVKFGVSTLTMASSSSQGLASILHDAHRSGTAATGGDQTEEGHKEGPAIRQGLDRGWVRQGDRKHGVQLMHL